VKSTSSGLVESVLSIAGQQSAARAFLWHFDFGLESAHGQTVTLMARKTARGDARGLGLVVD